MTLTTLCIRSYIAIALLLTVGLATARECKEILEQGVRNTYQELRTGNFRNTFTSQYCNKDSSSSSSGSAQNAAASYGSFAASYGQNNNETASKRAEYCGQSGSSLSDDKYVLAMSSVADANIVAAWKECTASDTGVMILGEVNGEDLVLTYIFRATGNITKAIVQGSPSISGATCEKSIEDKSEITTGGRIQNCKRGAGAVTVTVNTDFQAARFFIPPPITPPQMSTFEENCANWKGPKPYMCLGKQYYPERIRIAEPGKAWCEIEDRYGYSNTDATLHRSACVVDDAPAGSTCKCYMFAWPMHTDPDKDKRTWQYGRIYPGGDRFDPLRWSKNQTVGSKGGINRYRFR